MGELLTAAQMRGSETRAIETGEVSGLDLMERAGEGVVAAILDTWPERAGAPGHAVVLCGPGNNGGDGFVVARLLHGRGWTVEVFAMGDPEKLREDARLNRERWSEIGRIGALGPGPCGRGDRPDLLVDALFGTGLARAIPREAAGAMGAVKARAGQGACATVAVDCPSGLHTDTGALLMPEDAAEGAVAADLTVTFHAAKRGHYLDRGPRICGRLSIRDIGLAPDPAASHDDLPRPGRLRLVGAGDAPASAWPGHAIAALRGGHKYRRGHAVVLSGGAGRGGAARMAARGALRIGAGLVTLVCPPEARAENAAQLDAVMLRSIGGAPDLTAMLEDPRLSALCLGPGLGGGEGTRALVAAALAAGRATVLDADALTSFQDDPAALFAKLHGRCILTPHEGEFARLFPDLSQTRREGRSKVEDACAAADRAGCSVLLKGPDTVIASPGGHASVNAAVYDRAAPWLGTAGAGDVLAGMIAGLAAAPSAPHIHLVAEAAAWLHVSAARQIGPGLIAEDLPEALPAVYRSLGY